MSCNHLTQAGLEVDEEAEAQAQELYDQGMEFFKAADLKSAYFKFQDALALVPIKVWSLGLLSPMLCMQ